MIGREPSPNPCEIVMNLELKSRRKLKKKKTDRRREGKLQVCSVKKTNSKQSFRSEPDINFKRKLSS